MAETQPRLREVLYDANGNHKEWKCRGNLQRTLSWDEYSRLVSVKESNQDMSRALYDGAGLREDAAAARRRQERVEPERG